MHRGSWALRSERDLQVRATTSFVWDVVRLVRREPATSTEFRWDPDVGDIDPAAFDGVDVAVNLGGVAVAPLPWTDSRRRQILLSRVSTTSTLAQGLAALADGRRPTLIR